MTNNVTIFLDNGYFQFKKHEILIFKENLLDQKRVLSLIFFNIKIEQNLELVSKCPWTLTLAKPVIINLNTQ